MKQLSPHEPINLTFDSYQIELIYNKCILPDASNIREDKDVDEIWMKGIDASGEKFIFIWRTEDAKLLAESILKLCQ